jgi:hypothetical protein
MKYTIYIKGFFLLILLYTNCISEFDPPSRGYENLLVVEAFLSNDDAPFEVKLSRSTPIDTTAFIPESGASISLESASGEIYSLFEINSGVYQSNTILNPQAGQEYRLMVQTRDSKQYESAFVTMRETPPIDELTFEYEDRPVQGVKGLQFLVSTSDPNNNTWYYRYEYDETWMFRTPYDSYLIWEDGQLFQREERINTCWKFNESTNIRITTSKNLTADIIKNFPLLFVSNETDRLKTRYSLNVKQYSLSEESYNYWVELQKATESLGTLFDPQPSIIRGNISNVNDESEVVLGYFDAASIQVERIFVNPNDFERITFPNYYSTCYDSIVSPGQIQEMVDANWMIVSETTNEAGFPAYLFSFPICVDCRFAGSNVKPDYWY